MVAFYVVRLCRPFEISHFTMFTTFRLNIRKKKLQKVSDKFRLIIYSNWMGNEWTERDRLVFEFTSILRCALPQSNRSAPPSVDKQKSPKCFLLSTGTESQQPNQCREAVHGCTFTSKETFSKFVSSSIAKYLLATPVFFYEFSHLIFFPPSSAVACPSTWSIETAASSG